MTETRIHYIQRFVCVCARFTYSGASTIIISQATSQDDDNNIDKKKISDNSVKGHRHV